MDIIYGCPHTCEAAATVVATDEVVEAATVFSGDRCGDNSPETETRRDPEPEVDACLDLVLYFFGEISCSVPDEDISTSSSKNGEVS